jgi:hypothetical protein
MRFVPFLMLLASGCLAMPEDVSETKTGAFTSEQATLLDFEFDGHYTTDYAWSWERIAEDQLLYTIGLLNGHRSVGRLDRVVLTDLRRTTEADGRVRIDYHARLPVAWGSKTNLPTGFEVVLPRRMDELTAFSDRYSTTCVDWAAHDVDAGSMWYYFRPARSGCSLGEEDVVRTRATVTPSTENTTGKYPEYDLVWDDGELRVVAIFGKNEDGATSNGDVGISAYNRFVSLVRAELGAGVVTTPANVPNDPGVSSPDVTFALTRADGRRVSVVTLLVDNVRTAGAAFDRRYEELSTEADLIFYNGHAGLGSNVRALARKGDFRARKYQIFFMNGCDTFAYVDDALAEARAALNPDDPTGTKYMEIVTNGMPAFFSEIADDSMAIFRGLLSVDAPMTYEEIFEGVDSSQVVVVTGEEDNTFEPGGGGGGWAGLNESGTVARREERRFQTPELAAGRYRLATTGDGDADLYVRIGAAPTTRTYSCRPYESDTSEECIVTLPHPSVVHVMVRGYAGSSRFELTGRAQ